MGLAADTQQILSLLEKALATGDVTSLIKEDLELEAYNSLYRESDQNEFRLLKTLARKNATSIKHEYTRITEFAGNSSTGFFGQDSLPKEAKISSTREILDIKLMGEIASVFALAQFQTPIRALDKNNLVDINQQAARLSLLRKINQACYRSDTRDTNATIRFKGIKQQIEEGTTTSPVKHIVDMDGKRLTPMDIREKAREIAELYGRITALYMPPLVLQNLENQLDPVERLMIPRASGEKVILGQSLGGMNTGGGVVNFELDNDLTPAHIYGKPPTAIDAKVKVPGANGEVIAAQVNAPQVTGSKWTADNEAPGNVYYYVSYTSSQETDSADSEGDKIRLPSNANQFLAVLAGGAVTITLTGVPSSVDSVKIYRGKEGGDAHFVKEIKRDQANLTFQDLNAKQPGTAEVYGLTVASQNYQMIQNAGAHYQTALPNLDVENQPMPGNTICFVNLGPFMGVFDLARILFTASRDLLFAACAPEVAVPTKNVVWINVGTRV